jgi:transcription antitermination factor NusG
MNELSTETGNLQDIRAALGRDLEIGDIVDYSPFNSALAELVPDTSPHWHIVETLPNSERGVAKTLAERRFGVFVPEIDETVIKRGRKIDRARLMFNGYVFVFVWDIMQHLSRIETIPGVARLMHYRSEIRPAVFVDGTEVLPAIYREVPWIIADEIINKVRAVENEMRPLKGFRPDGTPQKAKKRRWSKWVQQLASEENNDIVAVRAWSAFEDGLMTLDAPGRNQTLLRALSLS